MAHTRVPNTASEMEIQEQIAGMRERITVLREGGCSIGFVPTMGALHEGHLSLIRSCAEACDVVVTSVFVNPLQFGPNEDFTRYPRTLESDAQSAEKAGTHVFFVPSAAEMYSDSRETSVIPGRAASRWEGEVRPGHFAGVLTVVAKLFNIVSPDVAFFGRKDFQQAALIRRMISDLDFPIEMRVMPTVRDPDGLAMSSRNIYLTPEQRARALSIPRALANVFSRWNAGDRDASSLESAARRTLEEGGITTTDYVAIVHPHTLEPVSDAAEGSAVLIAARPGETRLIDNLILSGEIDPGLRQFLVRT